MGQESILRSQEFFDKLKIDNLEVYIDDTVKTCYRAWKLNKCAHYSISHRKIYSINDLAKMFNCKIVYLPHRLGERYASALTDMSFNNKIIKTYGKINLKDYITSFIKG